MLILKSIWRKNLKNKIIDFSIMFQNQFHFQCLNFTCLGSKILTLTLNIYSHIDMMQFQLYLMKSIFPLQKLHKKLIKEVSFCVGKIPNPP